MIIVETKTIRLTSKEAQILRDVCFARMKVLQAVDPAEAASLLVPTELSELLVRQALSVFDFFRCAWYGNAEGVKRLAKAQHSLGPHAGCEYYDGMIGAYRQIMVAQMKAYTPEDVVALQQRLKGFVKALKAAPAQKLYIADCHFYHRRLNTEMDRRDFACVEEMNDHMIRQWNAKVHPNDTVYILGDFSMADGFQTSGVLRSLHGKKHLILGNHDERYLKDKHFEDALLQSVQPYLEIRDRGRAVILSHYPVFCYKGQYRRDKQGNALTYMLYGHVHNTHDERLIHRFIMETRSTSVMSRHATAPETIPCNMINCFCMFSDYQPMTLDEWIETDRKRREALESR